jgi:abortive infection bacteriophage resistance protein
VKYEKPALTFDQQAGQLIERGLVCDREKLLSRLRSVSYYRLSGYWYPFRRLDDSFVEGTTLEAIWRRYRFDRRFRLVVLDAIERVEVCIRTELVYLLAHAQGPFGYLDPANLPGLSVEKHAEFLGQLQTECGRSQERFIEHFRQKYGNDHELPPYWMVTELMTFGALLTLFRGCSADVKKQIAARFGTTDTVFQSWLVALNGVRNICAHHGRLWNRELGYKPKIPKNDARWHVPVEVANNRMFGVLTILGFFLSDIAPETQWPARLRALLAEYAEIPLAQMGFPDDWEQCPIWTTAASG